MTSHTQLLMPHNDVPVCAIQQTTLDNAHLLLTDRYLSRCYIYPMLFSGREEDFPTFLEQFEARVYALGLSDCLLGRIKTTPQKDVETNDERVKREGEEADRAKLQYMVWCELVQCLDKESINFIRRHKPNGTAAWTAFDEAPQVN